MDQYNLQESIKAQRIYCEEKGLPHFAPNFGVCWSCNQQIYSAIEQERKNYVGESVIYTTGISTEKAGSELVTGCPHCNRSYCD